MMIKGLADTLEACDRIPITAWRIPPGAMPGTHRHEYDQVASPSQNGSLGHGTGRQGSIQYWEQEPEFVWADAPHSSRSLEWPGKTFPSGLMVV